MRLSPLAFAIVLGLSAWVDCALGYCQHPQDAAGWFAIRAGERHWFDRDHRQHFHHDCGLALVKAHQAEWRSDKLRMAAAVLPRKRATK